MGACLIVVFVVSSWTRCQAAGLVFTDITAAAGVGVSSKLTESVTWGDYDNDGDPDLYLTNNTANNLFRNDGGGDFTDVTATAGVGNALFSVGTAFGDADNDGDLDLYVVNFGVGPDVFYRNDGPAGPEGEYQFTDVTTSAGTTIERSSRGMSWIDYDQDGLLDIYVNAIGDDLLYHNQGGLVFEERAATSGIAGVGGQGVGVVATDVNKDGRIDFFTGNRSFDPNVLFLNQGDGTFTDATASSGITEIGFGMGVISLDYDNDLDADLYWTTWPGAALTPNAFYENNGGVSLAWVTPVSSTRLRCIGPAASFRSSKTSPSIKCWTSSKLESLATTTEMGGSIPRIMMYGAICSARPYHPGPTRMEMSTVRLTRAISRCGNLISA